MSTPTRCADVEARLADHLAGILPDDEAREVTAHLVTCETCRSLAATLEELDDELDTLGPVPMTDDGDDPPAELLANVLARTTGSACERAEEHLPAFVDGDLDGDRAELVATHVAGCSACRALTETLAWTNPEVRALGRDDPGAAFTAHVVRVTTGHEAGREGWRERLWNRFARWAHRPGFTLEVAYAGTVALALLVATPGSPLRGMPGELASVARAGVPAVEGRTRESVGWVTSGIGRVMGEGIDGVGVRLARTDAPVAVLRTDAEMLGDAVLDGDVGRVSVQLGRVGGDLKLVWHAITSDVSSASSNDSNDGHDVLPVDATGGDGQTEPLDGGDQARPPSSEGAR